MATEIVQDEPATEWIGWHFLPEDGKLAHGPRTLVKVGKTYRVKPPIVICSHGLHASRRIIDALQYTPGPTVCRVRLGGEIVEQHDKAAGSWRTVLAMTDATDVLRAFSRWCALEVAHLWDMPDIVRRYLETGDESIRSAAGAAAWAAAWNAAAAAAWTAAGAAAGAAAWAVAWDAAWAVARAAAWNAAWAAAWNAAGAAAGAAAWTAARAVAWDAAWAVARAAEIERFNAKLESMVVAAMDVEAST